MAAQMKSNCARSSPTDSHSTGPTSFQSSFDKRRSAASDKPLQTTAIKVRSHAETYTRKIRVEFVVFIKVNDSLLSAAWMIDRAPQATDGPCRTRCHESRCVAQDSLASEWHYAPSFSVLASYCGRVAFARHLIHALSESKTRQRKSP